MKRVELEGEATFGAPYLKDIRHVWVRHEDGLAPGWPDEDPMDCMLFVGTGEVDPSDWDSTAVTLVTNTFLVYDMGDTSFVRYVPVHPDSVEIRYTAVLGGFDEVPSVEVYSPNGGEHWVLGDHDITWAASDSEGIDSVSIFLSLDGNKGFPSGDPGGNWQVTLATGVTADTSWVWSLTGGGPGSSVARIAIVAHDGGQDWNYDMSDTYFQALTTQEYDLSRYGADRSDAVAEPDAWVSAGLVYLYVPKPEEVELSVYDVRGRRVRTLLKQPLAQGLHRVAWDALDSSGQSVTSGVYFYEVRGPAYRLTGKFVVVH